MKVYRSIGLTSAVLVVCAISGAADAQPDTTYLYDRDGRSAGTIRRSDGSSRGYDADGRKIGSARGPVGVDVGPWTFEKGRP